MSRHPISSNAKIFLEILTGRGILLVTLLLFAFQSKAQVSDSVASQKPATDSSQLKPRENPLTTKQKIIIAGLSAHQVATFYVEYKWWWEGNGKPFQVKSDGWFDNYSRGLDKCGHFYTFYIYFEAMNELMKWADFSNKTRLIWAASAPLGWAISIELGDGFTTHDFSPVDLYAGFAGVAYGLLQEKYPYLKNFKPKFSYYPSDFYNKNNWSLTADYAGHIYWMTMDFHNMLPQTLQGKWPAFLNIAGGIGLNGYTSIWAQREFFIGLDWNLGAFSLRNRTLQSARNIIDYYHIPAPGFKKTGTSSYQFAPLILN